MHSVHVLPDQSSQPWPPASWAPFAEDIRVADDWYSGRYANTATAAAPSRNWIVKAWGKATNGSDIPVTGSASQAAEHRLSVPVAADIAATGADLLFGDTPSFTIPEAHEDRETVKAAEPGGEDTLAPYSDEALAAQAAEERLAWLVDEDGWASTLIEGAEIGGALGGVFLRPVVAPEVVDHPILTVVHPDRAVPVFQFGHLVQVTFWRAFDGDKGKVWRHLEEHTRGRIEHALYVGSDTELGDRVHLSMRDETIGLVTDDAEPYGGGVIDLIELGIDKLLAEYVPNALPNRKHRTEPVGRSDTAGTEHLMAALDEVWTSWVRDIRLAKARLIVPDEFLDGGGGRGKGASFNMDREVFSPLSMDPAHMDKAGITLVQFEIRNAEHAATAEALFIQIIQAAGYSPQSFGLQGDGAAITATEVDANQGRSDATTGRKQEYYRRPLASVAESMLMLETAFFAEVRPPVKPMRPHVEFAERSESALALAQTMAALAMAKAASIETMVRWQHEDWDPQQVADEVKRIKADNGYQVSDPFEGVA